tara:strand:+ start:1093 stop:2667 length:1575 start_codon:yes stop_codon:yes gene_type:complete
MSVNIPPSCPDTHIFNKDACLCEPKRVKIKTQKQKKKLILTAKRQRSASPKKTQKKHLEKKPIEKRKRCPNGTRKDKKTGECVSKTATLKRVIKKKQTKKATQQKQLITVENTTPLDDRLISRAISDIIKESPVKKTISFKEIIPKISADLVKTRSFSPSVNKRLVSLRNVKNTNIFGCGLEDVLHGKVDAVPKNLKIKLKTSASGKPVCGSYKSAAAKKLMLTNLAASKSFECGQVVSPLQVQTNCWFNAMYMIFFVSDKGRKFFRFLRQLMIEGRQENGTQIKPPRLAQAFFLFNAYIESSYNLDDSAKTIMAEGMDTNILIDAIYKSIPKKYRDLPGLRKPGQYGNPFNYYKSIISYLSNNSLTIMENDAVYDNLAFFKPHHSYTGEYNMPDVIVVITYDDEHKHNKYQAQSESVKTRQLSFTRIYEGEKPIPKGKPKSVGYILDSAVVRSTNKQHFCSLITCNGQQMGFDGASLVRLGNISWKDYLNNKVSWTFEINLGLEDKLRWNFHSCYQQLYYYRV